MLRVARMAARSSDRVVVSRSMGGRARRRRAGSLRVGLSEDQTRSGQTARVLLPPGNDAAQIRARRNVSSQHARDLSRGSKFNVPGSKLIASVYHPSWETIHASTKLSMNGEQCNQ